MSHWALKTVSVSINHLRELTIESREHVVEGKGVGCEVYPSRVGSEKSQSLTRPQTIRFTPDSNVRLEFPHVSGKAAHVILPGWSLAVSVEILLKDGSPLVAADVFLNSTDSL